MKYPIPASAVSRRLRDVTTLVAFVLICPLGHAGASAGATTYLSVCAGCHGAGAGSPPGIAPDLRGFKGDDAAFLSVVKNGRPGTLMPPWQAAFSDAQIMSIRSYLKDATRASKQGIALAEEASAIP